MNRVTSVPLTALLLIAAGACDDRENPAAPSSEPDHAITATASYTIKSLGTLGGSNSRALAISNAGETVG